MLGKRTRPAMGKLPDPLISGDQTGCPDPITSPKSPLDFKIRSPRGFKNCVSGVGLGIVAALEISGAGDDQTPAKFIVGSLNLNRSEPIPIGTNCGKTSPPARYRRGFVEVEESEIHECCENYTCVTSHHHGPNNKSVTRVFFDGDDDEFGGGALRYSGVSFEPPAATEEAFPAYPSSSFLSSCYLCRKTLHGRDIYMYRGEKAFCSTECRNKQIVSDERKEKCRSEASRSTDIAVSPYTGEQLFSTGIIAAS